MDPDRLDDIVEGGRVEVRLGATVAFSLGPSHRRDFGELRAKISEQVGLARRAMVLERPMRKGQ